MEENVRGREEQLRGNEESLNDGAAVRDASFAAFHRLLQRMSFFQEEREMPAFFSSVFFFIYDLIGERAYRPSNSLKA